DPRLQRRDGLDGRVRRAAFDDEVLLEAARLAQRPGVVQGAARDAVALLGAVAQLGQTGTGADLGVQCVRRVVDQAAAVTYGLGDFAVIGRETVLAPAGGAEEIAALVLAEGAPGLVVGTIGLGRPDLVVAGRDSRDVEVVSPDLALKLYAERRVRVRAVRVAARREIAERRGALERIGRCRLAESRRRREPKCA